MVTQRSRPPPPPPPTPLNARTSAVAPPPSSYQCRSAAPSLTSGLMSRWLDPTVPMFFPWNSPTRPFLMAKIGCSPALVICSSFPPTSTLCGAHIVSSMLAPLSSLRTTERLDVSEPSRFRIVVRSPTECTTATTSTIAPWAICSTSAIFLNA